MYDKFKMYIRYGLDFLIFLDIYTPLTMANCNPYPYFDNKDIFIIYEYI